MSFPTRKNPFLFLVGCPRSGTTLLNRIIDAHPSIAMMHREQHWIPRFFLKRTGIDHYGNVTPDLVDELLADPRFTKMDFPLLQIQALINSKLSYAQFVEALFHLYGEREGKPLVGEKTPENNLHIPILHSLWPTAKIVHLIRDGRDVCLSAIQWKKSEKLKRRFRIWRDDPILGAAYWWRWHVRSGRKDGLALGTNLYYEIRYEDLVQHPEQECRKLCHFLDIEYSARMPVFHEGKTKPAEGRDAKHAWLGITPGLRNWRTEMNRQDVALFEAVAGEVLEEFGYELGAQADTQLWNRVQPLKALFAQDAASKVGSIPEDW